MSRCYAKQEREGIIMTTYDLFHGKLEKFDVDTYAYTPSWGDTRLTYTFTAAYPNDAIIRTDTWYRNGLITGGDVTSF